MIYRLAYSVIDQRSSTSHFTLTELKDLFTFDEDTDCQTHDLLGCDCKGQGGIGAGGGSRTAEDTGDVVAPGGIQQEDLMQVEMLPGLVKASEVGMVTAEGVSQPNPAPSFHDSISVAGVVIIPILMDFHRSISMNWSLNGDSPSCFYDTSRFIFLGCLNLHIVT